MNATLAGPPPLQVIILNTNIGHTENSHSCIKRALYQIGPLSVSFSGIELIEGTNAYVWQGPTQNIAAKGWMNGAWADIDPITLGSVPDHKEPVPWTFRHTLYWDGTTPVVFQPVKNISVREDRTGVPAGSGFLPIQLINGVTTFTTPTAPQTNICTIPLFYRFRVTQIAFTNIQSIRVFGPQGNTHIEKRGVSADKVFETPSTPEF